VRMVRTEFRRRGWFDWCWLSGSGSERSSLRDDIGANRHSVVCCSSFLALAVCLLVGGAHEPLSMRTCGPFPDRAEHVLASVGGGSPPGCHSVSKPFVLLPGALRGEGQHGKVRALRFCSRCSGSFRRIRLSVTEFR